jgi:hypothetical protein
MFILTCYILYIKISIITFMGVPMELWLNFGFAWISIILAIFLSAIYILQIAGRRPSKYKDFFNKLNKNMRKTTRKSV